MKRFAQVIILLLLINTAVALAEKTSEVALNSPIHYDLQSSYFQLDGLTRVDVDCVAIRMKFGMESYTGAWLVAMDSGREIWRSDPHKGKMIHDSRVIFKQKTQLDLPVGKYALFQFGGGEWDLESPFNSWSNALNDLADLLNRERPDKDPTEYLEKCFVSLKQPDGRKVFKTTSQTPSSACEVNLRGMGDNARETQTFWLSKSEDIEIIGTGEWGGYNKHFYDYGWVENALSGEPVWVMDIKHSKHAGGTSRNMISRIRVELGPGYYTAGFRSDGSHAVGSWNAMPPSIPDNWGLCVRSRKSAGLKLVDIEDVDRSDILVSMLRIGDDENRKSEFQLKETSKLHIHALGEGRSSGMYDYGRIVDLESGREVWVMDWDECRHAGGTKRNMLYDGVITLPAGRYQAIYTSDDSHSFAGWNSPYPKEAFRYGMVITKR